MSKGDFVTVKSEIGGKLESDTVTVTSNGGKVEADWDRKTNYLVVRLLNRAGDPVEEYQYAASAVRSIRKKVKDE